MQRLFERWADERAQTAIMFAGFVFMFGLFGALVLDVGLLVNDRRDAQNDVDKAALAGALELTLQSGSAVTDRAAAEGAAREWAASNGIDLADPTVDLDVEVVSNCYSADDGLPTGVQVTVTRDPETVLIGMLGLSDWRSTATATACAGRPIEIAGFLPFALSETSSCFRDEDGERVPNFGEFCNIVVDSNAQGLVGELGIEPFSVCEAGNSSASVLETNIIDGTMTFCRVGDSVQGNAGHNVGKTHSGIEERIAGEGICDANFSGTAANFFAGESALNDRFTDLYGPVGLSNGRDDFYEIWEHPDDYNPATDNPAEGLLAYDCDPGLSGLQTSPRNVNLIIVEDFASPDGNAGPKSYIVQNFARIYLEGCSDSDDVFSRDCDFNGGGKFTIHARFVDQFGLSGADLGLNSSFGNVEVFLAE
jgi:Flp pilus assembly protein TadG